MFEKPWKTACFPGFVLWESPTSIKLIAVPKSETQVLEIGLCQERSDVALGPLSSYDRRLKLALDEIGESRIARVTADVPTT
jgi:hypothetical protein